MSWTPDQDVRYTRTRPSRFQNLDGQRWYTTGMSDETVRDVDPSEPKDRPRAMAHRGLPVNESGTWIEQAKPGP
jgi:hypothetical protein